MLYMYLIHLHLQIQIQIQKHIQIQIHKYTDTDIREMLDRNVSEKILDKWKMRKRNKPKGESAFKFKNCI